jgi:hypothetical protein
MVENKKTIKEELKEEEEEEEILPEEAQTQKVELTEEAQSDELTLPFTRQNLKDYLWRLLIIKRVEIRDAVLRKNNQAVQISYIDGYIIDNPELEEKVVKTIVDNQTIPIDLVKEVNKHKKEVYLYSTSQGVYYSLMRNVIPKLKSGAVLVCVAYQQSDYPQPTIVLEHPSKLPTLKAQFEAMEKAKR